jgi:ATP-dependent protease HslVU (ClpYQ) peptidase subunit
MSTIVVVHKDNRIAIAADTLTSYGSTLDSAELVANASKIVKYRSSYIAAVGPASIQLALQSFFTNGAPAHDLDSELDIFHFAQKVHEYFKTKLHLNPKEYDGEPFESSQFCALIANKSGIYGLHALRSVQKYRKYYAEGSGHRYALGALAALYSRKGSAKQIARRAIEITAGLHDATATPVEVFAVRATR